MTLERRVVGASSIPGTAAATIALEDRRDHSISRCAQEVRYKAFRSGAIDLAEKRKVPRIGIEPMTRGFSVHCSTD